jgi:hypothetical protein
LEAAFDVSLLGSTTRTSQVDGLRVQGILVVLGEGDSRREVQTVTTIELGPIFNPDLGLLGVQEGLIYVALFPNVLSIEQEAVNIANRTPSGTPRELTQDSITLKSNISTI